MINKAKVKLHWGWFGHLARQKDNSWSKSAMEWRPRADKSHQEQTKLTMMLMI